LATSQCLKLFIRDGGLGQAVISRVLNRPIAARSKSPDQIKSKTYRPHGLLTTRLPAPQPWLPVAFTG